MELLKKLEERFSKRVVVIFVASFILFIVAILIFSFVMISRIGKTKVIVKYAPFTAEVKMDGKKIKNSDTVYLDPGKYKVEVSLEHFEKLEEEVEVNGDEVYAIGELLAIDDEGYKIAAERTKDFQLVEQYGAKLSNKKGEEEAKKYPIISYLPINTNGYSVSYVYDRDKDDFKVELVAKNLGVFGSAIYNLYNISENIKPAEYNIVVRGYQTDIFGEFKDNNETDLEKYIRAGYGDKVSNYEIYTDKIIEKDEYIGLIMAEKDNKTYTGAASEEEEEIVVYRMVLRKDNGRYSVEAVPYPITSRYVSKNAPVELLDELNRVFPAGNI